MVETDSFTFYPGKTIRQCLADTEWSMKVGVGGMLHAFSMILMLINPLCFPLVVCLLAVTQGYLIVTLHEAIEKPDSPLPSWANWGELLIAGLTWMAIESIFLIIWISIIFGALILGNILEATQVIRGFILFSAWPLIVLWSFICLIMVIAPFNAAFRKCNFAKRQEIRAAFDLSEFMRLFLKQPKPLLQAWLLQQGIFSLSILVPIVTIIGIFVLPSTIFVAQAFGARLLAQAFRLTLQTEADPVVAEN